MQPLTVLSTGYSSVDKKKLLLDSNLNMIGQQGYAPPNSDRREGVLRRKRLEYLDCVSQYYDIPDTERSDDEINMLRQVFIF